MTTKLNTWTTSQDTLAKSLTDEALADRLHNLFVPDGLPAALVAEASRRLKTQSTARQNWLEWLDWLLTATTRELWEQYDLTSAAITLTNSDQARRELQSIRDALRARGWNMTSVSR